MSGFISSRRRLVVSVAAVVTAVPVLLGPNAIASTSSVMTGPVNLRARALTVTTTFLPDAQVGYAYNVQLTAVGGTAPYTWSAARLPAGFELSKTGVLGGIPRDASISSSLIFTVVDSQTSAAKSGVVQLTTLATPTGHAWAWGRGSDGVLGNSNLTHAAVPAPVFNLTTLHQVSSAVSNAMALRTDGTVAAWGNNSFSQMGTGNQVSSNTPVIMPTLSSVRQVSSNSEGGLALRTDGTVWSWGYDGYGQLGDSNENYNMTNAVPLKVPGLPAINSVAACGYQDLALAKNGTVYTWGEQMPAPAWEQPNLPPLMFPGLSSIRSIACSDKAGYALRNDGTVWAWGTGLGGQLGNGDTADSVTPVQVQGITSATAVAAGSATGYALLVDGTVEAWGDNSWGQLGSGINTQQLSTTPVPVAGLSAVRSIAGGQYNGYALRQDGTVWAWGDNEDGELGNGTYTIFRNTAGAVPSLKNVVAIGAGESSYTPMALVGG